MSYSTSARWVGLLTSQKAVSVVNQIQVGLFLICGPIAPVPILDLPCLNDACQV